jgi:hypothetical protein
MSLPRHGTSTLNSSSRFAFPTCSFFDGEKIKDLAEFGKSTELISTGINQLLGLDLIGTADDGPRGSWKSVIQDEAH